MPPLFPITTVPWLIRSPVRLMFWPASTEKVEPEVMVTPSREELAIPWISAPCRALVKLPPMIAEPLRMTDDESHQSRWSRWYW